MREVARTALERKTSVYWTCPYCGSNLDPGERCDCGRSHGAAQSPFWLVKGVI